MLIRRIHSNGFQEKYRSVRARLTTLVLDPLECARQMANQNADGEAGRRTATPEVKRATAPYPGCAYRGEVEAAAGADMEIRSRRAE